MAKYAVSYFDKSFAATSRLRVEPAFSKSKKHEHRPWSKHSKGSSRYDALHKVEDDPKSAESIKKDSDPKNEVNAEVERKKQEFIDVMMGGKKNSSNSFWANDDGEGDKKHDSKPSLEKVNNDIRNGSESDSSGSDSDDDSVDVMNSFKKPEVSDMDFLKSKVQSDKADLSDGDSGDDGSEKGDGGDNSSSAPSSSDSDSSDSDSDSDDSVEKSEKDESMGEKDENMNGSCEVSKDHNNSGSKPQDTSTEPINSSRLFVRNLPFSTTEEEIRDAFSPFGHIIECHIPVDDTNRNKGYAFVKFSSDGEAASAMESLDGTPFQGRLVHIIPARGERNNDSEENEGHVEDMTHKMKKEFDRRKDASENTAGWNASFVRGDAVVDNLASRLGLEKGAILDVKDGLSSGNAAVRLALGETQVIEENKKYFESHGVDISGLESLKSKGNAAAKRSSNVILVKNLPFDTTLDELSKVFNAIGGNTPEVLLPPSKTIALAIYEGNNDAKRAFRKLAYKRFKHVPLYLEWAILNTPMKKENSSDKPLSSSDGTPLISLEEEKNDDADVDEEATDGAESTTVYVKNLNFRTTEDALKHVFEESIGNVRSVRIPTKAGSVKAVRGAGSNDKSIRQSMGYGFVEFKSDAAARKALSVLQGKVIDGHDIDLKISKRNASTQKSAGGKKKPSTKIIVRNVPFQASRTEILQLFGSFGQLKTVRLPKKFDGGHRGFAFVEFTGAKEALNAMKALASTHLYGRHLVLEWADDKGDIDTLREKAKRDSTAVPMPKNKKIRFE